MTKAELFFTAYFMIGIIFTLFSLRSADKYNLKQIGVRAIIAFVAWPFLLNGNIH